MLDDPEERSQRRRTRVDAADAEEIEVNRPWKMILAEILSRPDVDQERPFGKRQLP